MESEKTIKLFSLLQRTTVIASDIAYSSALKMLALFGSLADLMMFLCKSQTIYIKCSRESKHMNTAAVRHYTAAGWLVSWHQALYLQWFTVVKHVATFRRLFAPLQSTVMKVLGFSTSTSPSSFSGKY